MEGSKLFPKFIGDPRLNKEHRERGLTKYKYTIDDVSSLAEVANGTANAQASAWKDSLLDTMKYITSKVGVRPFLNKNKQKEFVYTIEDLSRVTGLSCKTIQKESCKWRGSLEEVISYVNSKRPAQK